MNLQTNKKRRKKDKKSRRTRERSPWQTSPPVKMKFVPGMSRGLSNREKLTSRMSRGKELAAVQASDKT